MTAKLGSGGSCCRACRSKSFIKTGDRSALSYFVKPMADYFIRAFRDG